MSNTVNYSIFKSNQYKNNVKLKIKSDCNKITNSVFKNIYEVVTDFCFDSYSVLGNLKQDDEDEKFNFICDSLEDELVTRISLFVDEVISRNLSTGNNTLSQEDMVEIIIKCIKIHTSLIFTMYREFSVRFIKYSTSKMIPSVSSHSLYSTACRIEPTYNKYTQRRAKLFAINLVEHLDSMHTMFVEEYYVNVISAITTRSLKIVSKVLTTKVCDFTQPDVSNIIGDYFNIHEDRELLDLDEVHSEPSRYNYIADYRKLSKVAIDNGFELIRHNGDHGIFKNSKGVVVIPQGRDIGKSLSIHIQKSIFNLVEL